MFHFVIIGEETVSAFNSAPWFTYKDISPAGLDSLPIKDKTETGSKRELDFGMLICFYWIELQTFLRLEVFS